MNTDRRQAQEAFLRLAEAMDLDIDVQVPIDAYRVTDVSPGDVDFTDADWNGDQAQANAPNPSQDDDAPSQLDQMHLLVPEDGNRDAKASWKLPFRSSPDNPVNLNAISAAIAAINGARGGVEDVEQDALESAYRKAVRLGVEGGLYDDTDDAPDLEAAADDGDADPDPADDAGDDGGDVSAASVDFDPDIDLAAQATGTVSFDDADVQIDAASSDTLAGVIWGAGDHDLSLGGQPTPVRVPPETVQPTFEALQQDVAAGDVTIGFDHPDPDSVAAQTGIVDIGEVNDVALSADDRYIVMTDSELDNDRAAEAAEAGAFDDLEWSIVGNVAIRRDDAGDPVIEDGRVVLDAIRITRVDAVDTGAVDAASIVRDTADLPDLKDNVQTVQQTAAADVPNRQVSAAVEALQASASALTESMQDPNLNPDDIDDLDDARDMISAAASVIEDQENELQAARAKADGFESLLSAHGVDADDYEDVQAAAQALIDEQTADVREEIAEVEADLASYDVDNVEARAEELAGDDPQALQNLLNARKAEAFDAQQKAQRKGAAAAKTDTTGRTDPSGGGDNGGQNDDVALQAMDGADRIEAEAKGLDPAEYISQKYGLNAAEYDAADELHDDILAEIQGDA